MNLDEIEARANAATPGPWRDQHHECSEVWGRAPDSQTHSMQIARIGRAQFDVLNAAFIAAARTDVPALIARVRELERDIRDHVSHTGGNGLAASEDLAEEMRRTWVRVDDECAELRAECERTRIFGWRKFAELRAADVEQMRTYGLSYEGVRKVLREHDDGDITFAKLMDLIRAAARAMAGALAGVSSPDLMKRVQELEEQLITAEEQLEQRTRERDHERATLAGVLACSGFAYSEGETLLRAQAAEAQQLAKQMMDERDALRREIAALMDDH